MSAWSWMLLAAGAVVITAFVVTTWLWIIASHAKPGTDQANARLDAVRTGLAAGAGAGAAVGLMLAFRRQHHQEIATDLTDRDATERRITELYTKAVEQLGSDKAPVRLGGLYALERLAQDNPEHRQTIVNVICAYLRMPFSPTAPARKAEPEAAEDQGEPDANTGTESTWRQERQVRLTAQRILAEHLRDDRPRDQRSTDPPDPRSWPGISLNLAGATLIDFNLRGGVVADADFRGATFTGKAFFGGTTFTGSAEFNGAAFTGEAWFMTAAFFVVWFSGATFTGDAHFDGADFGGAEFDEATFGDAWFDWATFTGDATFGKATFTGDTRFGGATFTGKALFGGTTFTGDAWFGGATFTGGAYFDGVTFTVSAWFDEVTFTNGARFSKVTFGRDATRPTFDRSRVLSPDAEHVWPTGWRLGPDGSGGYTVVREDDAGRS